MPTQTTVKSFIAIPDGCKVQVDDGSGYADLGAVNSAVNNTLEYDVNKVDSANAGVVINSIRNMRVTGSFDLINLDPELVESLGGGIFERVATTGAVDPEDQVQTAPQVATAYDLILLDSSSNNLKPSSTVAITSVTGSVAGALVADTDYVVSVNANSVSGYSITYVSGAISGSENVTIVYPSQTMTTSQVMYMGTSTTSLTTYAIKFTHTDDNALVRELELFSATTSSGGFMFNFKGANEDGIETMTVQYEATIDSTLTDGRQLAAWTYDTGAE